MIMDWDELSRDSLRKKSDPTFRIPVKKVAVTKDQIRKLPDGTTIIVDKPSEKKSND
jgi:hypothetical protein